MCLAVSIPPYSILVAVKRKYESERRSLKDAEAGDSHRIDRIKKAKYEQRKLRVSVS